MSAYLGPRAAKPGRPACTGRSPPPATRSTQAGLYLPTSTLVPRKSTARGLKLLPSAGDRPSIILHGV